MHANEFARWKMKAAAALVVAALLTACGGGASAPEMCHPAQIKGAAFERFGRKIVDIRKAL